MENWKSRTESLIGKEQTDKLNLSHVCVFGLGGVGSFVVEALARAGVGTLTLVDGDDLALTNINRQLIATVDTIGRAKVDVQKERALSINPDAKVYTHKLFYLPENESDIDFSRFDYVVDAVDTVTAKLIIIQKANQSHVPVISCMGTGNKLDPTAFCVRDLSKTSGCPLARVMRRELKQRGITHMKVVYSEEAPRHVIVPTETGGKHPPASISFVPPVAGFIAAGEVICDILGIDR